MSAAGIAVPVRRPAQSKAALARTAKEQRRGYARAVLAALARSLQGRPTPQIRQIVKKIPSSHWVFDSPPSNCKQSPKASARETQCSCRGSEPPSEHEAYVPLVARPVNQAAAMLDAHQFARRMSSPPSAPLC